MSQPVLRNQFHPPTAGRSKTGKPEPGTPTLPAGVSRLGLLLGLWRRPALPVRLSSRRRPIDTAARPSLGAIGRLERTLAPWPLRTIAAALAAHGHFALSDNPTAPSSIRHMLAR